VTPGRLRRAGLLTVVVLLVWVVVGALLPSGLPFGVILLGLTWLLSSQLKGAQGNHRGYGGDSDHSLGDDVW